MNSLYIPFYNHIADGLEAIEDVKAFLKTQEGQVGNVNAQLGNGSIPIIEKAVIKTQFKNDPNLSAKIEANPKYGETNKRIDRMINTAIVISLAVPIVFIGLSASYFGGHLGAGIVVSLLVGMLPTSSLTGVSLMGIPIGLYLLNLARASNPLNNTIYGIAFLALSYVGLHFASRLVKNEVDKIFAANQARPTTIEEPLSAPLAMTESLIKVGHSLIVKHILTAK